MPARSQHGHPKTCCPANPGRGGGGRRPGHSLGRHECCSAVGERGSAHPPTPALRRGMRRGKGRGRGPEKSGSHRKRSLDAVSGSFQPRQLRMLSRSSVRAGSPSSPATLRVPALPGRCGSRGDPVLPRGGSPPGSPTYPAPTCWGKPITEQSQGLCSSCAPQTGGGGTKPQTGTVPKMGRDQGYIHSSSSSIFILHQGAILQLPTSEPAPQMGFGGRKGGSQGMQTPKLPLRLSGRSRRGWHGQTAALGSSPWASLLQGWLPSSERERKAPFK